MPTLVVSEFVLALRAADEKSRTTGSLSQSFGIRVPTDNGFGGEMGQFLDHGLPDAEEQEWEHDGEAGGERGLGLTHADSQVAGPSTRAEVTGTRDVLEGSGGGSSEVCTVSRLHAPSCTRLRCPLFSVFRWSSVRWAYCPSSTAGMVASRQIFASTGIFMMCRDYLTLVESYLCVFERAGGYRLEEIWKATGVAGSWVCPQIKLASPVRLRRYTEG